MSPEDSPDKTCAFFAARGVKLKTKKIKGQRILFVEGNAKALQFLGELLIAQSKFKKDCGFWITPKGPGSKFFRKGSAWGIYIHRLPCLGKRPKL